jgi:FtsP/CotA-like multicopper oxidase with cupredoxin domain
VAVNGRPPDRETFKDTINVPAGGSVDIAFVMRNPGTWMLHCHILDHEDGGMMTTVVAE